MKSHLSYKALLAGSIVGALSTVAGVAIAQASEDPGSTPQTGNVDGCQLPSNFAHAVDLGMMTEAEACNYVEVGKQATEARQRSGGLDGGGDLVVEGAPQAQALADCRAGRQVFDEDNDLLCNALLRFEAGEIKPNGSCGPPECPQEGTPMWRYSVVELRDLMGVN